MSLPLRKILDYLAEVGTAKTMDEFLRVALEGLQKLIPYDVAAGLFDVRGPMLFQVGASDSSRKAYDEYYQFHLPWFEQGLDAPPPAMLGVQALNLTKSFGHTEFGADFVPLTGARLMLSSTFLNDGHVINVSRPALGPWFTVTESAVLGAVTPHVKNLYSLFQKLSRVSNHSLTPKRVSDAFSTFTAREAEIASLLCAGLTAAEIATRLFISVRTVGSHVERIYDKLDIRKRSELRHKVTSILGLGEE